MLHSHSASAVHALKQHVYRHAMQSHRCWVYCHMYNACQCCTRVYMILVYTCAHKNPKHARTYMHMCVSVYTHIHAHTYMIHTFAHIYIYMYSARKTYIARNVLYICWVPSLHVYMVYTLQLAFELCTSQWLVALSIPSDFIIAVRRFL